MSKTTTQLLKTCKTDKKALEELIKRFYPLIKSYSKKSSWKIESEDMESILTIKLIELAKKDYINRSEAQNVIFIANSLKNKFIDTVRSLSRENKLELVTLDKITEKGECDCNDSIFKDMIKNLDLKNNK